MPRFKPVAATQQRTFILLAVYLGCVFLAGGSAREDVASLVWLRPLALVMCAVAILTLKPEHMVRHKFVLAWSAAVIMLVIVHLVPLPPELWNRLPGRGIVSEIDQMAGNRDHWRSLSMTPRLTRNGLWSLAVPLAVLLLAVQLEARQLRATLMVVCALALTSGVFAVVQLASDPRGILYLYNITNNGSAVGLFANRNHQALLLASSIPLIGVMFGTRSSSSRQGLPRWVLVAGAIAFLIPLVLVNGSRAGVVMAFVASLLTAIGLCTGSKGFSRLPKRRMTWVFGAGAAIVVLLAVASTILAGRDVGLERLLADDLADDLRLRILPTLGAMMRVYLPWGSGIGSFAPVYKLYEPDALLFPQYVNHAHNDWLELVVTGGVPAVVLLGAVVVWVLFRACALIFNKSAQQDPVAAASLIILLLCAMGSLSDYPLRVPSLTALSMLCLVCLSGAQAARPGAGKREAKG